MLPGAQVGVMHRTATPKHASSSDVHQGNAPSLARMHPTNGADTWPVCWGMSHSNTGVQTALGALIPGTAGLGGGMQLWVQRPAAMGT